MHLARIGNRYFTETEPWKTRKENPEACGNTFYVCLQISAALSVLFTGTSRQNVGSEISLEYPKLTGSSE
jgi:methionyl-tRNA synthetase